MRWMERCGSVSCRARSCCFCPPAPCAGAKRAWWMALQKYEGHAHTWLRSEAHTWVWCAVLCTDNTKNITVYLSMCPWFSGGSKHCWSASSVAFTWTRWSSQDIVSIPFELWKKRCLCNYFPSPQPHHYLKDLPPSPSGLVLVVYQELCFDIHVAAWLGCRIDICEVLGRLLLLCFLFTPCTFSSLSPLPRQVHPLSFFPFEVIQLTLCLHRKNKFLCDSHNNPRF